MFPEFLTSGWFQRLLGKMGLALELHDLGAEPWVNFLSILESGMAKCDPHFLWLAYWPILDPLGAHPDYLSFVKSLADGTLDPFKGSD